MKSEPSVNPFARQSVDADNLSSGEDVAYPFIGKPDRNLYRDYYEIIQHPTSLRTIQKQVRGTDSRKNQTKTTAFPTWKSFENEVAYIWRNAREYNEDGSDISMLAGILEVSLPVFAHKANLIPTRPSLTLYAGAFQATGGRGKEACSGSSSGRWSPRNAAHQAEDGCEQRGA